MTAALGNVWPSPPLWPRESSSQQRVRGLALLATRKERGL